MKNYTDLEQTERLVEILPLESADMWWAERYAGQVMENGQYIVEDKPFYYISLTKPSDNNYSQDTIKNIPCWSLAALMNILPSATLDSSDDYHYRVHCKEMFTDWYDNAVDACVEMIFKLKENNLI